MTCAHGAFLDAGVEVAAARRTEHDLLVSIAQLLEENLAELRHVRAAIGASSGHSSVEIKTSTRGVDISTKVYEGSDIIDAEGQAVASYFRVLNEVQERVNAAVGK